MTIVAPLNVPSLLGQDASELYAKNLFNLLALMMKDNIITIDWTDEVLAKTALTHDGKLKDAEAKPTTVCRAKRTHTPSQPRKRPERNLEMRHGLPDRDDRLRRPLCLHAGGVRRLGDHRRTCRRSCTHR